MLFGLSDFPEVQFTLHEEEDLEHAVCTIQSQCIYTLWQNVLPFLQVAAKLFIKEVSQAPGNASGQLLSLFRGSMCERSRIYGLVRRDLCAQRLPGLLPRKYSIIPTVPPSGKDVLLMQIGSCREEVVTNQPEDHPYKKWISRRPSIYTSRPLCLTPILISIISLRRGYHIAWLYGLFNLKVTPGLYFLGNDFSI